MCLEEEASTILLENDPEDESSCLEKYQTKKASVAKNIKEISVLRFFLEKKLDFVSKKIDLS